MPQIRRGELRRRRVRRKKLAALRSRYKHAEDEAEKAEVLKTLFTIAPWLALEFREQAKVRGATRGSDRKKNEEGEVSPRSG